MTDRTRDFWICSAIFLAALLVRLLLAAQLPFPPLDDPAGYIQLARNIAGGRGLVSDVLWNYWVSFPSVTHPSNEFWMPLASIIMAGSIRMFGDTLLAAQLPGIVSGALLAPLVYVIGRTLWPAQRRWGLLTAVLIALNAVLVYQAVSADSTTLYTLLATLALFCGALAIDRKQLRWMVFAGFLCGLSYITRSHGLLLPATIGLIILIGLRREPRLLIKFVVILALGCAAFLVPWWLRNLSLFGVTQPVPLTTIMASRGYEDWFNYTQQPTLASITLMGWGNFIGFRIDALVKSLGVILVMTFPCGFIGLPVGLLRRENVFRLLVVYGGALYLGVSLVLPSAAVTGSFYHSAGPFVVWAVLGSVVALKYLFERPRTRLISAGLALMVIALGVGQALIAWPAAISQSRVQGQQFADITRWILANLPDGEPLITTQANTLNYTSGHPTLALPPLQDVIVLRQLADRYSVRYIVITEKIGQYPRALDHPQARARLITQFDETLIYELER